MTDGSPSAPSGDAPSGKIKIAEMIDVCQREAHRITSTQDALVAAALRVEPDPEMIRRAAVFDAIALFLVRLEPYPKEIASLLKQGLLPRNFQANRRQ